MSEKKNSYDKFWLYKDMENMGYIFEYCDNYCKKLFDKDVNKVDFIKAFMNSKCRYEMETGHPTLLSHSAYDTVEDFVEVDLDGKLDKFKHFIFSRKVLLTYVALYIIWFVVRNIWELFPIFERI